MRNGKSVRPFADLDEVAIGMPVPVRAIELVHATREAEIYDPEQAVAAGRSSPQCN